MSLFKQIEGPTKNVLNQLLADPNLSSMVTYRKHLGQTFSVAHGHNVDTYEENTVPTLKLKHNQRSIATAQGDVEAGDPLFIFRYSDMPEGLSLKDQIVDESGAVLKVKDISDIFKLAVSITAEGV